MGGTEDESVNDEQLIAQYLDVDDDGSPGGVADVRLRSYGVPIWALIGHLQAVQDNVEQVAADYMIPRPAVEAAIAFYKCHKAYIDARLLLNSA
jgi:hypothetical protein